MSNLPAFFWLLGIGFAVAILIEICDTRTKREKLREDFEIEEFRRELEETYGRRRD